METAKKRVVIVGAGFGGVRAALDLRRFSPKIQVVLINDSPYHCYHPDLYDVASAITEKERKIDFRHISSAVNIPLEKIFKHTGVEVFVDIVTTINLQEKRIDTKGGHVISFDYIVMGLGSETNFFGIPDAEKFSHTLKNNEDALNIRNQIEELTYTKDEMVRIVIAGGGFTGVELAGSLRAFTQKLSIKHRKLEPSITILELTPHVLNGMPEWAQIKAQKKLENMGIKVILEEKISSVEESLIQTDKQQLPYDYLIWTTGVKGTKLANQIEGLTKTPSGQVIVKNDLSVENFPFAFVVGDMSKYIDKKGAPVPPAAWAAEDQGEVAAQNIARLCKGKRTQDFEPHNPGFVVPVGKGYAISNIFGINLSGLPAWAIKRGITLMYLSSILPFSESYKIWQQGLIIDLSIG